MPAGNPVGGRMEKIGGARLAVGPTLSDSCRTPPSPQVMQPRCRAAHDRAYNGVDQCPADGIVTMRYLVTARVKPSREVDFLRAIESGTLGSGSVAGDEYLRNMESARLCGD